MAAGRQLRRPLHRETSRFRSADRIASELVIRQPEEVAWLKPQNAGWIGGWANGTIMAAGIKKAVETVGAENVDGQAIRDAMATIQLDIEGAGNIWEVGDGINSYNQTLRMWQYSVSTDKWGAITDWYRPPLLGG